MSNNVCYTSMQNSDGAWLSHAGSRHKPFWLGGYVFDQKDPYALSLLRSQIQSEGNTIVAPTVRRHAEDPLLSSNTQHAYSILLDGTVPAYDLSDEFSHTEKVKTPHFREKVRAGDIVVNPYQKHKTQLSYIPVPIIKDEGPCNVIGDSTVVMHIGQYYPLKEGYYWSGGVPYSAHQHVGRRHGTITGWIHPFDNISRSSLKASFGALVPVLDDPDFVQATFAEANGRSVDFLTSVFELPETILSIGDVLKGVKRMIQNYITRRNLTEKERLKYIQRHRILLENARAKREKFYWDADRASSPRKEKLIRRAQYQERRILKLERENVKILRAFATTISNLWLRLRYEILPNIYLCQDLVETAQSQWNVFQTTRDKVISDYDVPALPGYTFSGTSNVTWKVMVKYGYSNLTQNLRDLRKAFSMNIFLTMFELGKLTFVIDWFFSVGNFLGAAFGKPQLAITDGHTLSSKWIINGVYTNDDDGTKIAVSHEGYTRNVITSEEFSGIFFRINLNWMRYADAGALLFGELKRHFKLK